MAAERSFSKSRTERPDLEAAADARLRDAIALIECGRSAAAILMGLYAVEIRLKVVICRRLDLDRLPKPFEIHDLAELLIVSGLSNKLLKVKRPRNLQQNWEKIVALYRRAETIRYQGDSGAELEVAREFMALLDDPTGGVLRWLAKQK